MREIIFRGYQDALEKFVYGSYVYSPKVIDGKRIEHWIMREDGFKYAIENPDTIGQYTGLEDMDGKDIYEGDILTAPGMYTTVVHIEDGHTLVKWKIKRREEEGPLYSDEIIDNEIIVSGNIYENPELLEVE